MKRPYRLTVYNCGERGKFPMSSKRPSELSIHANVRRVQISAEELTDGMRVSLSSKTGGCHGLWTRRFVVATWSAAADNHFVGIVLAPLTVSSDSRRLGRSERYWRG